MSTRISRSRIELRVRKETSGENTIPNPSIVTRIGLGRLHNPFIYIFLCSYTPINRARRDPPPVVADIVRFQMSRIPEKLQSTLSIYPKIFNYITLVSMNIPRYRSREFALFTRREIYVYVYSHSKRIAGLLCRPFTRA